MLEVFPAINMFKNLKVVYIQHKKFNILVQNCDQKIKKLLLTGGHVTIIMDMLSENLDPTLLKYTKYQNNKVFSLLYQ